MPLAQTGRGFECHNPTKKDNTEHRTCPGTVPAGAFITTASPVLLKKTARGWQLASRWATHLL